jgi:hypothetical protein
MFEVNRNAAVEPQELALRGGIANRVDRKRDMSASRIDFPVRRRDGLQRRQRERSEREHSGDFVRTCSGPGTTSEAKDLLDLAS